ncbi:pyridoxamine 5'-phosphate oxidase family protein [Paraburkholderia bannensis]|uniref:pyridoxamine 5'-phosphate oxidase family protein n=1 Tax=Paraburkholderia bannensis TaxID=765414 RepID=UPI002AAF9527|nr:pyridoxamine 5'-phosphate oxidase family protein [Paraburkholderia bannensis]
MSVSDSNDSNDNNNEADSIATQGAPSARTRVRRIAQRADYDRATLHAILDAAYVCHVAFADAHGVHCIPTACWREGDHLYIHGSNGSRMLKLAAEGAQVCVTVTHIDGLVLARSAFNHSMNYRSAMIYGAFEVVADGHKSAALDAFMEHIAPGRAHEARAGNRNELAATTVLRLPLDEAVAKVRAHGVCDDEEDLDRPVWAGVLPMALRPLAPERDGNLPPDGEPAYVREWASRAADAQR